MKRYLGVLALCLGMWQLPVWAVKRHVVDWDKEETKKLDWSNDGDIHIFDCILTNVKLNDTDKTDFLKINCPHDGIWVKFTGSELKDVDKTKVKARYFHITTTGQLRFGRPRPDLPQKEQAGSSDAALGEALTVYDIGNYDEAAKRFLSFTRQYPQDKNMPYAWFMLGQALCAQNKFDEAVAVHKAMLSKKEIPPMWKDHAFFRVYAVTAGHLGKRETAIKLMQEYLTVNPNTLIADDGIYTMGALYLIDGKLQEATACFKKILTEHPDCFYAKAAESNLCELAKMLTK